MNEKQPQFAHLADVPLEIEALLEGPQLRAAEVLALGVGSIVATGCPPGENVQVFAGKALFGLAELSAEGSRLVLHMVHFGGRE